MGCTQTDAGATTNDAGVFALEFTEGCGLAAGTSDCGAVYITSSDGGREEVLLNGQRSDSASTASLSTGSSSCTVTIP